MQVQILGELGRANRSQPERRYFRSSRFGHEPALSHAVRADSGKMTHRREFAVVTYEDNVKATRERMLQAETALDAYLHGQRFDAVLFRELTHELSDARDDFLAVLTTLWPAPASQNISATSQDHRET